MESEQAASTNAGHAAAVPRREVFAWAFYDFANSSFTTVIVTAVYVLYFREVVVPYTSEWGDFLWGLALAISMLFVAVSSPILGAVADYSGAKRKFLIVYASTCIVFTAALYFVGPGMVFWGTALFVLANIGFAGGNVFYNAFLPEIATRGNMGRISGYGWAIGYVGGMLCLVAVIPFASALKSPSTIGTEEILDWPGLCSRLAASTDQGPTARVRERLPAKASALARAAAAGRGLRPRQQEALVDALNGVLSRKDLYDRDSFSAISLTPEAADLARQDVHRLPHRKLRRLNRLLLEATFAEELATSPLTQVTQGADRCKITFPLTALFFLVTALPTFFLLRERAVPRPLPPGRGYLSVGFEQFLSTLKHIRRFKELAVFLLIFLVYNDGVTTVIAFTAPYAKQTLAFAPKSIFVLLLIVNVAAAPGALIFGLIADRIGAKRTILVSLAIWAAVCAAAAMVQQHWQFELVAVVAGLAIGAVQSVSRTLVGLFTPPGKGGEFFGFQAVCGKFASMLGPLVFGLVSSATGSQRIAVGLVAGIFVVSFLALHWLVDEQAGIAAAERAAVAENGSPAAEPGTN